MLEITLRLSPPSFIYQLGLQYEQGGFFIQQNQENAIRCYQTAAEQGYGLAHIKLGDHYLQESNTALAIAQYKKATNCGENTAWMKLAESHYKNKNLKLALETYVTAAQYQLEESLQAISKILSEVEDGNKGYVYYSRGKIHEGDKNWKAAIDDYAESDKLGSIEATETLAIFYQKNHAKSIRSEAVQCQHNLSLSLFKKAAKAYSKKAFGALVFFAETDGEAAYVLGQFHEEKIPTSANLSAEHGKTALQCYQKSRDLAHIPAIVYLGKIYEDGLLGQKVDVLLAVDYFIEAALKNESSAAEKLSKLAEQNIADIQYKLAINYYKVKNDSKSMLYCLLRAAAQGHVASKNYLIQTVFNAQEYVLLAQAYEQGVNTDRDLTQAFLFYKKAAVLKDAEALYQLAQCYEQGKGTSKNISESVKYYNEAMLNGHPHARGSLERIALLPDANACTVLADYLVKTDMMQSLRLRIIAVNLGHNGAKAYFASAQLTDVQAYFVAQAFHTGQMDDRAITKQPSLAVHCYQQITAQSAHHLDAQLHLMALYQLGADGVDVNKQKAVECAIKIAAYPNQDDVLKTAEALVRELSDANLHYELAMCYERLKRLHESIIQYKCAADQKHSHAPAALSRLSQSDSELAFDIGRQYEEKNLPQALEYYKLALQKSNAACIEHVIKLARSEIGAVYVLARYHYTMIGQKQTAIDLLMKAIELNHEESLLFLKSTQLTAQDCDLIANRYEIGKHPYKKNLALAVHFKIKALSPKNPEQLMSVAGLCEQEQTDVTRYRLMAWEYYMKAAELGHFDAVRPLARLAEYGTVEQQQTLESFFRRTGRDPVKALYWEQRKIGQTPVRFSAALTPLKLSREVNRLTAAAIVAPVSQTMPNINQSQLYTQGL